MRCVISVVVFSFSSLRVRVPANLVNFKFASCDCDEGFELLPVFFFSFKYPPRSPPSASPYRTWYDHFPCTIASIHLAELCFYA